MKFHSTDQIAVLVCAINFGKCWIIIHIPYSWICISIHICMGEIMDYRYNWSYLNARSPFMHNRPVCPRSPGCMHHFSELCILIYAANGQNLTFKGAPWLPMGLWARGHMRPTGDSKAPLPPHWKISSPFLLAILALIFVPFGLQSSWYLDFGILASRQLVSIASLLPDNWWHTSH